MLEFRATFRTRLIRGYCVEARLVASTELRSEHVVCTGVALSTWLQVPLGFTLGQKGYSHAFAPSTSPAPRFGATRRFDDPRTVWLRPETEAYAPDRATTKPTPQPRQPPPPS